MLQSMGSQRVRQNLATEQQNSFTHPVQVRDVNQRRLWSKHGAWNQSGSEFTVTGPFIPSKFEWDLRPGHHVDMLWPCLPVCSGLSLLSVPPGSIFFSLPYISLLLADIHNSLFLLRTHSAPSFHTHIPMLKNKSVAFHGQ